MTFPSLPCYSWGERGRRRGLHSLRHNSCLCKDNMEDCMAQLLLEISTTPPFFFFMTCPSHDMPISYPLKFPYSPPFTDEVFLEHKLSLSILWSTNTVSPLLHWTWFLLTGICISRQITHWVVLDPLEISNSYINFLRSSSNAIGGDKYIQTHFMITVANFL